MGPKASASSQHKQHGGNAAFEGDEVQHRAWARREKSRLKTQERRQREKELRDAGDANAIARYEQQKAVAREYQRAKRRKSTQNAQPLDQKEPATAPQTFEDDPMSGIEDDEDSKIDEAFDSSEDDSYSASRRWPIARSAKKRVRYEEDDTPPLEDDQEQEGEAACCALDTPQDPTAILGHSINGGVSITRPPSIQHEEPLTAPPPAVHAVHDRKEQEEFKPPPGSIVVNLCDSDTEITVTASARWPKEETMDVVKKEDEKAVLGAEEEEVAILKVQDKGASKDVVPPLKPSSKREQELKLKLRGLRLQKEEVDIELELLMMQQ